MSVIVDGYDTKNCRRCKHWRPLGIDKKSAACHYLLDTGNRCVRKDGKCLSRLAESSDGGRGSKCV